MKHPYELKGTPLTALYPCAQRKHFALNADYSRLCSLRRATDYSGNYARILAASLLTALFHTQLLLRVLLYCTLITTVYRAHSS